MHNHVKVDMNRFSVRSELSIESTREESDSTPPPRSAEGSVSASARRWLRQDLWASSVKVAAGSAGFLIYFKCYGVLAAMLQLCLLR